MKFEDPDTFAAYYSDFIKRMYPKAVGAGSDVDAFTTGLNQGVRGSYATAEGYPDAIRNAYSLVSARVDSMKPEDNPFGSGPTEAQQMQAEGFGNDTAAPPSDEEGTSGKAEAAAYGAGAGLVAGRIAQGSRLPPSPNVTAAQERLTVAREIGRAHV